MDRLLVAFAGVSTRAEGAEELARAIGAEGMLVLVPDPETGTLLPAPGFAQTLAGGPSWRAFVRVCAAPGLHEADVDLPRGSVRRAVARSWSEGITCVFFGAVSPAAFAPYEPMLRLVGALVRAELDARVARGEMAAAREAERRADELVHALDAARAELTEALARAERLNDDLEDAHRRKDDFLAMLGHELRNPLAGVAGALGVLRALPPRDDAEARARAILERQTDQLTKLVDDLLDVARVTRDKITLDVAPIRLADVARRAVETTISHVAEKAHLLTTSLEEDVWVSGDVVRLEQVVTNLLGNAIKYTKARGHIRVEVRGEGDRAVLEVHDDGVGIAPDMLERVFEPFVQLSPTLDRTAAGLGIGLTLVARLVRMHGGRVDVTSREGEGSTFVVELPRVAPPTASAPGAHELAAAAPTRSRRRVLVVDDNVDAAEMLCEMLQTLGHDVRVAHDGRAAVAAAREDPPDVVLLDIGLPEMDGYEVARALRCIEALRRTKLVALTGYGRPEDVALAKEAGFDQHLLKPLRYDDIEALVRG